MENPENKTTRIDIKTNLTGDDGKETKTGQIVKLKHIVVEKKLIKKSPSTTNKKKTNFFE